MGICLGSLGVPRGEGLFGRARYPCRTLRREISNLLPNNRRHRRTCYALCHILYPVSAAHTATHQHCIPASGSERDPVNGTDTCKP